MIKRIGCVRIAKILFAAVTAVAAIAEEPAAAQTWVGPGTNWNTPSNWSPAVVPNSPTAAVSFTGAALGNVNISSSVQAQSLSFSNPTGSYTLSSSAGAILSGVTTINVAAGVANQQTIQLAPNSGGNLMFPSGANLTITNSSTAPGLTLLIGQNTVIGTPGVGSVVVNGPGRTEIAGTFASVASGNNVIGGLGKNGTGTLILSNANNVYFGGTFVNGGTLQLGAGTAIPTGNNVTVASGATFDTGGLGNGSPSSSSNAIGGLDLNGGTFRVPSGSADYWLNRLVMTGGTVDFMGTSNFRLHLTNADAGITTNASSTTATWIGAGTSQILNNGSGPMIMTVHAGTTPSGIDLDAGIILSNGGSGAPFFYKQGAGVMRLTNPGNTAGFQINQGAMRVDDMAALGSGQVQISNGTLRYGGATAASSKPLILNGNDAKIQVLNNGTNLALTEGISQVGAAGLTIRGPDTTGASSTLTLAVNNSYSGPTNILGNAILAIPTIANGGVASPIGTSPSASTNLQLGGGSRGTLLLTGTNPNYSTNRGLIVGGLHSSGTGGAIGVQNAGTNLTVSGHITDGGTLGSLIKTGPGTLTLTGTNNNHAGGTFVEAGTLNIGSVGNVLPPGGPITVFNSGTLRLGYVQGGNASGPVGTLTLNGGTMRVPAGAGDFFINKLVMTGGTVDCSGADNSYLLLTGFNPGVTINSGMSTWIGSGFSSIVTDTGPITINTANGGTLNAGLIIRAGSTNNTLIKSGMGTLILTNSGNAFDRLVVDAGIVQTANDNTLGQGQITVNPLGTVRYTASATTARTFNLFNGTLEVPSGTALTMNGATVGGGFLRGNGAYNLTGGTSLTGVTTFTNTNLNVTGPASITNFAHNGNLTVNSGQTLNLNFGTNGSAGRLTINGTANVTEFVSNGVLTVPNGGLINNTLSNMVLGGGSTSFVGSVANPGGKIDLGGQQLHVRGGLLVTNGGTFASGNGVRNGTTVADFGALVKGTGPYQSVITQNGGQYLPGNSPGTSQVGDFFINGGGNLIFQITDAGPSASFPSAPGTAGNNPGWGLTQVFTSLNFTATPANPFTITMQTQLPPPAAPDTPGLMSSFDPNRAYQWMIFDLQPGAVFNGTFDPNAINFATAQFVNPTMGGTFSLSQTGGQVFLTFTPVPEPGTILAVAFGGLIVGAAVRRRRRRLDPPRTIAREV